MRINNLEWSKIKKHTKTFSEIEIPEGWRLPTIYELMQVYETDEAEKFDEEYKKIWHWFFCQQTKWAKEYNYVSRLCLGWDSVLYSRNSDLAYSGDRGRVVFVQEVKEYNLGTNHTPQMEASFNGANSARVNTSETETPSETLETNEQVKTKVSEVNNYKCGHKQGQIIILDSNELSYIAYEQWRTTVGWAGDNSLCWDCWNKKKEKN